MIIRSHFTFDAFHFNAAEHVSTSFCNATHGIKLSKWITRSITSAFFEKMSSSMIFDDTLDVFDFWQKYTIN